MTKLTKYSSFKALKLHSASRETKIGSSKERYLAFEKFINLLQTERNKVR